MDAALCSNGTIISDAVSRSHLNWAHVPRPGAGPRGTALRRVHTGRGDSAAPRSHRLTHIHIHTLVCVCVCGTLFTQVTPCSHTHVAPCSHRDSAAPRSHRLTHMYVCVCGTLFTQAMPCSHICVAPCSHRDSIALRSHRPWGQGCAAFTQAAGTALHRIHTGSHTCMCVCVVPCSHRRRPVHTHVWHRVHTGTALRYVHTGRGDRAVPRSHRPWGQRCAAFTQAAGTVLRRVHTG